MKPYSGDKDPKGISGLRKSKATPHRARCLRVDKKAARVILALKQLCDEDLQGKDNRAAKWAVEDFIAEASVESKARLYDSLKAA